MAGRLELRDKQGRGFTLRPLGPGDRTELETMYEVFEPKRVAQGLPPDAADQRARWLDSILSDGLHLLVEIDGAICGHGMLLPFSPDAAELANFLHQSIRDRGIGTALNRALVQAGRERGLRRIWLSVEPSNQRAIRSYEKVGFRRLPATPWAPEIEMDFAIGSAPD
ncbi:MAG: GNAT family N-acetyltransferase [Gemmatimonadota bacterium]